MTYIYISHALLCKKPTREQLVGKTKQVGNCIINFGWQISTKKPKINVISIVPSYRFVGIKRVFRFAQRQQSKYTTF
jgi:hypothetical protein